MLKMNIWLVFSSLSNTASVVFYSVSVCFSQALAHLEGLNYSLGESITRAMARGPTRAPRSEAISLALTQLSTLLRSGQRGEDEPRGQTSPTQSLEIAYIEQEDAEMNTLELAMYGMSTTTDSDELD